MSDAVYLFPDAALFLVLLRLVFVHAHITCPREFAFLVAWWTYCVLSLHSHFPAAGHLVVWAAALPLLWSATSDALSGARRGWAAPALALCAAGAMASRVGARWGASAEMAASVTSWWLAIVAGAVLLAAALRNASTDDCGQRRLRAGIGAYLVLYGGGVELIAAFGDAGWLLPLALLCAALWLALAVFIGPTPEALINPEKLALAHPQISQTCRRRNA